MGVWLADRLQYGRRTYGGGAGQEVNGEGQQAKGKGEETLTLFTSWTQMTKAAYEESQLEARQGGHALCLRPGEKEKVGWSLGLWESK